MCLAWGKGWDFFPYGSPVVLPPFVEKTFPSPLLVENHLVIVWSVSGLFSLFLCQQYRVLIQLSFNLSSSCLFSIYLICSILLCFSVCPAPFILVFLFVFLFVLYFISTFYLWTILTCFFFFFFFCGCCRVYTMCLELFSQSAFRE